MVYINNIYTGLLVFPFIAAVFTMPYAIYQYNRYGSVSKLRTLIIYSFILYMLIAFFMVSLPLPDRASTVGNRWQDHLNLIPCKQIWMYWRNRAFNIENIRAYMTSMSLWQLLFNILLTLPFGVYMRYYFKLGLRRTILYSFLLSLFYETSQLTALFGIYPGPYRLADVEDLICNTMGGAVGWQVAYMFMVVLPSRDEIDAACRAECRKVTGMRRIWSVLFDYICSDFLFGVLVGGLAVLLPDSLYYSIYGVFYNWTFFCLFSLIQVILTKGSTLGHGLCRMVLVSEKGGVATTAQFVKRYLSLWFFTEFPLLLADKLTDGPIEILHNDYLFLALALVSRLYFVAYLIIVISQKNARMPHEKISGTFYMAAGIPVSGGQSR